LNGSVCLGSYSRNGNQRLTKPQFPLRPRSRTKNYFVRQQEFRRFERLSQTKKLTSLYAQTKVLIPHPAPSTDEQEESVEVNAKSIGEAITELQARFPGIRNARG